jgi:hypothetical protein
VPAIAAPATVAPRFGRYACAVSSRVLVLPWIIVAAACGDNIGPDFDGTYQVVVTATTVGDFPPVRWPGRMALVLELDEMEQPSVTLDGIAPTALEFKRTDVALDVRTLGPFPLELVDPGVCDFPLSWTGDRLAIINYHFEDDRVEAHTSGIAYCQRRPGIDPDSFMADFDFDLVGERSLRR